MAAPADTLAVADWGLSADVAYGGGMLTYSGTETEALEVGARYLLFLTHEDDGEYVGYNFGRFRLDGDDRLRPVEEVWLGLPEVAALTGLTVDEAVAKIQEANAEFAAAVAAAEGAR